MLRQICSRAIRMPVMGSRSFSSMRSTNSTFVQQRTQKEFNWQKLVTVWTPPEVVSRLRAIDAELNVLRMESKGAPTSVQPIDWSYWESKIQDKAAVASIRKEYESIKFTQPAGLDLSAINTKLDSAIDRAAKNIPISQSEIALYQQRIVRILQDKEVMFNWTALDWYDRYPGLEKQIHDRWEEGYQLLTEAEEKIAAVDISAAQAAWKKGQLAKLVDEEDLHLLVDRIGDQKVSDESDRLEAVGDALYKGIPEYDAGRIEEIKEKEKKAKEKEARIKAEHDHWAHQDEHH